MVTRLKSPRPVSARMGGPHRLQRAPQRALLKANPQAFEGPCLAGGSTRKGLVMLMKIMMIGSESDSNAF